MIIKTYSCAAVFKLSANLARLNDETLQTFVFKAPAPLERCSIGLVPIFGAYAQNLSFKTESGALLRLRCSVKRVPKRLIELKLENSLDRMCAMLGRPLNQTETQKLRAITINDLLAQQSPLIHDLPLLLRADGSAVTAAVSPRLIQVTAEFLSKLFNLPALPQVIRRTSIPPLPRTQSYNYAELKLAITNLAYALASA